MSRLLFVLCLLTFFPFAANATSISSSSIVNTSCSGTLTTSLVDGASFACAGNFILDGGSITSDSLINLSADGDLFLDNLTLVAPNISLSVLTGMLKMGSNVILNAGANLTVVGGNAVPIAIVQSTPKAIISWANFDITLNPGAAVSFNAGSANSVVLNRVGGGALSLISGNISNSSLDINGPVLDVTSVPEPSAYAMVLLGLGLITFRRKA
jgi:hypothetical protein